VNPVYLEAEEIYNLACPVAPIHYQYNPVKTVKTSVMGAINMLGLAKRVVAKILQASTSEVYGNPSVHPQTERYRGNVNPIGLRSCYDEGKRCAETLFFDYHRQRRPDITLAREHLKWHPMVPLKVGLQKTIDYFDDLLSRGMDRNETYFMLRDEKLAN
jgi:UDP-glucuronate decarboxylase